MVLELYCRKAGRRREGRKREAGHGHVEKERTAMAMWREGGRKGEEESRRRE